MGGAGWKSGSARRRRGSGGEVPVKGTGSFVHRRQCHPVPGTVTRAVELGKP